MGNTCKPMAVSFQCMTKSTTNKKKFKKNGKKKKMGSIKDRNSMDLTEAEDIKKRWPEYTEELYKKDLYDPNTTMV